MNIIDTIKSFINKIFSPPIEVLDLAIEKLSEVQMISAQGINIGQYLSVLGDLPTSWQVTVSSLLLSVVLLGSLLIFRSLMRMYFSVKEGVKWW
ncbi:hypothetical protein [Cytobacillus gottheilii]|uniref:hypothetical protein n=1 Tax=Cytobacillus gottheilii TaxID=859144 RepID=UPI00249565F9|nr:hypothetical protein [Cytobacillus gottheilii]